MTSSSNASLQDTIDRQEVRVVGREVQSMFGSIANRYDLANSFLSLGIHKLWRIKLARHWRDVSEEPVLDLCTGTGDVLFDLKRSFSRAIGVDFCFPMLSKGKRRGEAKSNQIPFAQGDALQLPFEDSTFSLVTVSFGIRNLEDLNRGLKEINRVLKPSGKILVMEFGQPQNRVWQLIFDFYSAYILPIVGGILTGNRAAYEYLPKTSKAFPCRASFVAELEGAGFVDSNWESLTGGIAYIYSGHASS